jgi:hypothetical protein
MWNALWRVRDAVRKGWNRARNGVETQRGVGVREARREARL